MTADRLHKLEKILQGLSLDLQNKYSGRNDIPNDVLRKAVGFITNSLPLDGETISEISNNNYFRLYARIDELGEMDENEHVQLIGVTLFWNENLQRKSSLALDEVFTTDIQYSFEYIHRILLLLAQNHLKTKNYDFVLLYGQKLLSCLANTHENKRAQKDTIYKLLARACLERGDEIEAGRFIYMMKHGI